MASAPIEKDVQCNVHVICQRLYMRGVVFRGSIARRVKRACKQKMNKKKLYLWHISSLPKTTMKKKKKKKNKKEQHRRDAGRVKEEVVDIMKNNNNNNNDGKKGKKKNIFMYMQN